MCDSVVASGNHTASGVTLFGKNSDRRFDECQPFLQLPASIFPRGSALRCTHIEIPQVAETYRTMGHSPWWVWGFEHGVNEHGLAIGNHTVFSRETVEAEDGLIGMDLVRLGLERGRDAREALEVIAGLIETHGQGGAAMAPGSGGAGYNNSFLLADPENAWVLETSGRRWAARPVSLEALSNHYTLGTDWQIGSRDLGSFARGEGWWRDSGRVDVARAYRNLDVPSQISEGRLRRSRQLLDHDRDKHDVESFKRLLRDHREGGVAPCIDATPDEERFFTLCMHSEPVGTTTASMVAALPTDRTAPWPVWVSFGSPCVGIFLPVYLDGVLPGILARGNAEKSDDSAWWGFWSLQQLASRDFAHFTPQIREAWAPLEEELELERRRVELDARAEAVSGDPLASAELLSRFMDRSVHRALECAEGLVDRLA